MTPATLFNYTFFMPLGRSLRNSAHRWTLFGEGTGEKTRLISAGSY